MNATAIQHEGTGFSRDERSMLAKQITTLFDHWNLDSSRAAGMLGLADDNRTTMSGYRNGKPLGNSRDQLDRAGNLLAIHKNLRLLFPKNRDICYGWMTMPNKAFDGRTPVDTVIEYGFSGLLMVRGYLDRARGQ